MAISQEPVKRLKALLQGSAFGATGVIHRGECYAFGEGKTK